LEEENSRGELKAAKESCPPGMEVGHFSCEYNGEERRFIYCAPTGYPNLSGKGVWGDEVRLSFGGAVVHSVPEEILWFEYEWSKEVPFSLEG
jgi:hypothetical protein